MSDTEPAIEVSEKIKEQYDRKKAEMDAADPNLPDMSDDQFIKCLLDTLEAVDSGFYTTMPASEEMREILKTHADELSGEHKFEWIDPENHR